MSSRKALLLGAIVALTSLQVAAAGVVGFLHRGAQQDLAAARAGHVDLQRQLEVMPAAPAVEPAVAPSRWQLLDGPDVAGTMQCIQGLGDGAGVTFDGIKAAQSSTPGKQSFQIAVRGAPARVCAFVAAIEQHERLLVIETGRVLPGGADLLVLELGVATYHQAGGQ